MKKNLITFLIYLTGCFVCYFGVKYYITRGHSKAHEPIVTYLDTTESITAYCWVKLTDDTVSVSTYSLPTVITGVNQTISAPYPFYGRGDYINSEPFNYTIGHRALALLVASTSWVGVTACTFAFIIVKAEELSHHEFFDKPAKW